MKKKILALYDSNISYMERLQKYLSDYAKIPFYVYAFASENKLSEFTDQEEVDYLMASGDKSINMKNIGRIIRIYEESQQDGIYRYTPGDAIVNRLEKLIGSEEFEKKNSGTKNVRFVGVYSPIARSMKTSFSLVLGQLLAKRGNKVLYLNFESFSGMGVGKNNGNNLSDVMYFFNNLRGSFRSKFEESIIEYNGMDMISPAYYYLDLSYVTADIWEMFLQELEDMKKYDVIILDLSDYLQGLLDSFLVKCSIIYTLTANDAKAQNKIFHYEQVLREYNYDDILGKTRKFTIPSIRNLPEDIDKLLYTELSSYVKKETMNEFAW